MDSNIWRVLMSIGRIGSRAIVVGLGVLAVVAAPSWAAKGENEANAALCEPGGYPGVLLAQDGSAFKNAGKCTSYAAKGGQIAGVDAVSQPASEGEFKTTYSGFGLRPGSTVFLGARYQPSGISKGEVLEEGVGSNGTFVEKESNLCHEPSLGNVGSVVVEAETAAGHVFIREFPIPSGC
jgi:hypothetical protein